MRERPVLFSAPMVRALLDGAKTQTRRAIRGQLPTWHFVWPEWDVDENEFFMFGGEKEASGLRPIVGSAKCPFGEARDQLWVREAWRSTGDGGRCNDMPPRELQPHEVWYEAGGPAPDAECAGKLRPGMFMPRWASRITLEVTEVRVERLQAISEADAVAEGIDDGWLVRNQVPPPRVLSYRDLWTDINGPGSWQSNPWVWVVAFKRLVP